MHPFDRLLVRRPTVEEFVALPLETYVEALPHQAIGISSVSETAQRPLRRGHNFCIFKYYQLNGLFPLNFMFVKTGNGQCCSFGLLCDN